MKLPTATMAAALAALLAFVPFARAKADAETGGAHTVSLLTDSSLSGWRLVSEPATDMPKVCHLGPGGVLWIAGKPSGFIKTRASFANYRLHVEWRWTGRTGNGGILLHISSGPMDRVWPLSYQIQLKHGYAGDVLPMAGAPFATPLTTPPGARVPLRSHLMPDSEHPAGEWNRCDIVCRGGEILATVNGVLQNRIEGCRFTSGPIGIQFEGTPMEFRNILLTPLD